MTGSQGIKSLFHRTKSPEPGDDSFLRNKLRRIVAAVPNIPGGKRRRHLDRGRSAADRPCSPDGTRRNGRTHAWAVPAMQRGEDGRWQPPSLSRGSLSTSALALYATAAEVQSPDGLPTVSRKPDRALSALFQGSSGPYVPNAPARADGDTQHGLSESSAGRTGHEMQADVRRGAASAQYRPPPRSTSREASPAVTQPTPIRTSTIMFSRDMPGRRPIEERPQSWQSTPSLTSADTESTSPYSRPSTTFSSTTTRSDPRLVTELVPIGRMSSPTLRIKARRLSEVASQAARHGAIAEVEDGGRQEALSPSLAALEGSGQLAGLTAARKITHRARPSSRRTQSLDVTLRPAEHPGFNSTAEDGPLSSSATSIEPVPTIASSSPLRPAALADPPLVRSLAIDYRRTSARQPPRRLANLDTLGKLRPEAQMVDPLEAVDRPLCGQRHSSPASLIKPRPVPQILEFHEPGLPTVRYQLGNCIGRGQFGSVYRSLNLGTGQMAAIKRIRLAGMAEHQVKDVMREVELLKRLSHPSIVRYEGMSRDHEYLNIVLEFVENGSLGQILKAFGKLNEKLVAGYVARILEGLNYLHSEGVVHCDLKAANILSTKNGNVKLSDFGVSLNLKAVENIKQSDTVSKATGVKPASDVAGTPNWMAPEVISLDGASPASDIWSLGCTIIELLTGKPPYWDVGNSMSVLFRIVEDDRPPFPPDISDDLLDFLEQCFAKSPRNRPTAQALFEHRWIRRHNPEMAGVRPQDSIPFLRRVSLDLRRTESSKLFVEAEHAVVAETATKQTETVVLIAASASERSRDIDPQAPKPTTSANKPLPTMHGPSSAPQHASQIPNKSDCSVQ